jgi:hypothetical protein
MDDVAPSQRSTGGVGEEAAKFTAMVALLAIFADAAIGHALLWENDPYWTYWITKTFLIATVVGLGTCWLGLGLLRGAIIIAVHTLVLTIYYWTFSPIGLPSHPSWLDLEHTWLTGLPVHFGVIYLGYVLGLWAWRRRGHSMSPANKGTATLALLVLVEALVIVIIAGLLATIALDDFPGFTWFLVRVLITVPFLLGLWSMLGRDWVTAVVGALVLALIWATYGHFLGPVGLPDTPLRIFDAAPPPATSRFLDYNELWLISVPIYLVVMFMVLLIDVLRLEPLLLRRPEWRQ